VIQIAATPTTPALTLRPWRDADIPTLLRAHADPDMRRWQIHHIDDEGQAIAALADQRWQWAKGTRFTFAVVAQSEAEGGEDAAEPIGNVSIRRLAKERDAAEIGYWTMPQARGKSVATRAAEAALAWADEQWAEDPVDRYTLIHTLGNDASCRVAIKLGFAFAEDLPAHPPKFPNPGHLHVRNRDR
jgi:RimJ/RimL family protein N-acetyltransferase